MSCSHFYATPLDSYGSIAQHYSQIIINFKSQLFINNLFFNLLISYLFVHFLFFQCFYQYFFHQFLFFNLSIISFLFSQYFFHHFLFFYLSIISLDEYIINFLFNTAEIRTYTIILFSLRLCIFGNKYLYLNIPTDLCPYTIISFCDCKCIFGSNYLFFDIPFYAYTFYFCVFGPLVWIELIHDNLSLKINEIYIIILFLINILIFNIFIYYTRRCDTHITCILSHPLKIFQLHFLFLPLCLQLGILIRIVHKLALPFITLFLYFPAKTFSNITKTFTNLYFLLFLFYYICYIPFDCNPSIQNSIILSHP